MKKSIERIYHPYWMWEEVAYNMWGVADNKHEQLSWAIDFTGDHNLYGSWMIKVINDWSFSCEHNLSNRTQNRQAWIGHAACAYANKCPEDIVRKAWSYLTKEQQDLANNQADKVISEWERRKVELLCQK
tara:strand:+ start:35 stop:424 length:390 start_codon:yes stop_codon:yes gene_type:complete